MPNSNAPPGRERRRSTEPNSTRDTVALAAAHRPHRRPRPTSRPPICTPSSASPATPRPGPSAQAHPRESPHLARRRQAPPEVAAPSIRRGETTTAPPEPPHRRERPKNGELPARPAEPPPRPPLPGSATSPGAAAPESISAGGARRLGPPSCACRRSRGARRRGGSLPSRATERGPAAVVGRTGFARRRPPAAAGGRGGGGRGRRRRRARVPEPPPKERWSGWFKTLGP